MKVSAKKASVPIIILFATIILGMIIRPVLLDLDALPLEIVFLIASIGTIIYLFLLKISWEDISQSIGEKTKQALPAIHMLFSIGLLVGSWVISGTIPMFVSIGLKLINPQYLYVTAFILCALFSILTGTSWGSAGTMGIVLIAIGTAVNANLSILAAAIISGCYFGDKQSPISDTTIMAALGAGIEVRDHVSSMLRTTGPSFIIAGILYTIIGIASPVNIVDTKVFVEPTLVSLHEIFHFNILLIIPPLIILIGSFMKKPSLLITITSCIVACLFAVIIQPFTFDDVVGTLTNGFNVEMIHHVSSIPENVEIILTRGGLSSMTNAVTITVIVFVYIGAINVIEAMETVVNKLFANIRTRRGTILASLISSSLINGTTSNQYATAMIVGNAFQKRYDDLGIPRKVLSRSIEDYGTLIEPLLPWTTTGIYMQTTLGVPYASFIPYMFMNFINFIISPLLAITGIGCFYHENDASQKK